MNEQKMFDFLLLLDVLSEGWIMTYMSEDSVSYRSCVYEGNHIDAVDYHYNLVVLHKDNISMHTMTQQGHICETTVLSLDAINIFLKIQAKYFG